MKDFAAAADPFPVFTVEVGADGTNRNVALPGQPAWSWHVTGIAYWTSGWNPEYPYQHPWQLEQAIREGAITGQITVGFADSYTFMAEVDPELRLYQQWGLGDGLYLYWTHHAAGLTYDIDYTASLVTADWQPLGLNTFTPSQEIQVGPWVVGRMDPGVCVLWPAGSGSAYFRLRAQP